MKQPPNIGCFSTNEEIHNRKTITEKGESDFFSLSKSSCGINNKNKRKNSQILEWKKSVTNRMR